MTLREQQIMAWELAPADAKCIAQDVFGWWFAFYESPVVRKSIQWYVNKQLKPLIPEIINGWDWKDTLQTREEHEAMLLTEKQEPLGAEFEKVLYDNIEDLYEMDKEQWKPEVEEECEYSSMGEWHKAVCIAHFRGDAVIYDYDDDCYFSSKDLRKYRPIQTHEDKERDLVEQMQLDSKHASKMIKKVCAKRLIDKGYRKLEEGQKIVNGPLTDEQREKIGRHFSGEPVSMRAVIDYIQKEIGLDV